uniref:Uncharacterized protein n=1 Tax=Arundo donax TaxID=35708 RepID=A0A0A9DWM0_ARUDO
MLHQSFLLYPGP